MEVFSQVNISWVLAGCDRVAFVGRFGKLHETKQMSTLQRRCLADQMHFKTQAAECRVCDRELGHCFTVSCKHP